jgi:hypothetical protein
MFASVRSSFVRFQAVTGVLGLLRLRHILVSDLRPAEPRFECSTPGQDQLAKSKNTKTKTKVSVRGPNQNQNQEPEPKPTMTNSGFWGRDFGFDWLDILDFKFG